MSSPQSRTWQCLLGSGDSALLYKLRVLGRDSGSVSVIVMVAVPTSDESVALRVTVTFNSATRAPRLAYFYSRVDWTKASVEDMRRASTVSGAEIFDHRTYGTRSDTSSGAVKRVRRTTLISTAQPTTLPSLPPRALIEGLFDYWKQNDLPLELVRRFFRVQRGISCLEHQPCLPFRPSPTGCLSRPYPRGLGIRSIQPPVTRHHASQSRSCPHSYTASVSRRPAWHRLARKTACYAATIAASSSAPPYTVAQRRHARRCCASSSCAC